MTVMQRENHQIRQEELIIQRALRRSRPNSLIEFRDRALLSVCYEAACPIEKLRMVSVRDNGAIIAAKVNCAAGRTTCRNTLNLDGKPHILFDTSSKRLFIWMKKLSASGYVLSPYSKIFPAQHSNGKSAFKRQLGRTTASAIFERYLGDTGLKRGGFAGLRRAGVARQLFWGLHPEAVFAVSGYSHIRSIHRIAEEYELEIATKGSNPFRQISSRHYLLHAHGFSKLVTHRFS